MNFLKRAVRAVSRRKVKSLLMLVIFFVIANLVLAGFAIREATNTAKDAARMELGASLTLQYNTAQAMQDAMGSSGFTPGRPDQNGGSGERPSFNIEVQPVTEEMAQKVAGLEHVLAYNYIVSNVSVSAEDFSPVEISFTRPDGGDGGDELPSGGDFPGGGGMRGINMSDATLIGVYASELYDGFYNGTYTLEDGSHFVYGSIEDGVVPVLIEQTLATQNGLAVGDTITVGAMTDSTEDDAEDAADDTEDAEAVKTWVLTVTGIYSSGSDAQVGGMASAMTYNQMLVDYETALDIKENSADYTMGGMMSASVDGISSVVYYLDDPLNIDAVIENAQSLDINWSAFTLDANDAAYESMIQPLESVASTSALLVIVVSVAGVIILALILAMWIRERMYETGVLLSLGESKLKVAAQYAGEVLMVALVAFAISIFSGSLLSQSLGDFLLDQSSSSSQSSPNNGFTGMPENMAQGGGGRNQAWNVIGGNQAGVGSFVDPVDTLTVSVGLSTVLKLFGMGLLLALAATLIPTVLVMRYKPKDILVRAG